MWRDFFYARLYLLKTEKQNHVSVQSISISLRNKILKKNKIYKMRENQIW